MSQEAASAGYYLDAIFSSIRAFAQDLEASRRWLAKAEQTDNLVWRLSFLRAARDTYELASSKLAVVAERMLALGPAESLPTPLDRMHHNLATMRADLASQEERLVALEAREAESGAAIGKA